MTWVPAPVMASAISLKAALFQTTKLTAAPASTADLSSAAVNCRPPSPIRQTTGTPGAASAAPIAAPGA